MRFDYTAVGHVTIDVMADGSRRPGGGAFYSALQAARLGRRALILTRGVREEIEALLEPYREELAFDVLDAPCTTTLLTSGRGRERSQRVLAWAGEIGAELALDTEILHLAPIARETGGRWRGGVEFVGVTPQGLVRSWPGQDGQIVPRKLDRALLPQQCDAIVLSEAERESCAALLIPPAVADDSDRLPLAQRPVIAVTHGEAPTELHLPGGTTINVGVAPVERICDDLGAGDVFAAAFFIALHDGETPQAAAVLANAAAAVRVAAQGAGAIGDRAAIEARIASVV
jgi:sugar/nucleoside kinase (ribokinase family)